MSPRNFDKINRSPKIKLDQKVQQAPNLWYAFTAITGIDKIFSYTADGITINPVKDSENGSDQSDYKHGF